MVLADRRHPVRRALAILAPLLLVAPGWTSLAGTHVNLRRVDRLRTAERAAPDTDLDLHYRALAVHLPARGRVGFVFGDPAAPPSPAEVARAYFFLTYSLAPRQVVPSDSEPTTIAFDEPARRRLLLDPRFELVADFGEGLSVFRSVR